MNAHVANIRQVTEDGYPVLLLDINGKAARLTIHQKQRWLDEYGAVFLGNEWYGLVRVVVPDNPADGQAEIILDGFIQDEGIAALYRQFLHDVGGD